MTTIPTPTACRHCTVPTDSGTDVCSFCKTYVPPEQPRTAPQALDDAINRIDDLRHGLNGVIRELPEDVPMFALVDVVNALWNLRNASVLLDKAVDTLESDAEAVQR